MKSIPIALQPTYQSTSPRLARCLRIERTDGQVFCYSTASNVMEIDGEVYRPTQSFNPSDVTSKGNLDSDDLEVVGLQNAAGVTEDDLRASRWDSADFRVFEVDWSDPSLGQNRIRSGKLGRATLNRQTFVFELLGLMNGLSTAIGTFTQPNCRNNLGDAKCKVDMSGRIVSGTVDTCGTDFVTLTVSDRTEPDVTFDEGVITFTDGPAVGLGFEVKAYVVGLLITKLPIPYDVTGAAYTLSEGCIRSLAMCRDRFDNVVNFNGEPWLRGPDAAAQVGRHS